MAATKRTRSSRLSASPAHTLIFYSVTKFVVDKQKSVLGSIYDAAINLKFMIQNNEVALFQVFV